MHAQEDVLRHVLRPRPVLNGPRDQGEHQILVAIDQLVERPLLACPAALNEGALTGWGERVHRLCVLEHVN